MRSVDCALSSSTCAFLTIFLGPSPYFLFFPPRVSNLPLTLITLNAIIPPVSIGELEFGRRVSWSDVHLPLELSQLYMSIRIRRTTL